MKQTNQQGVQSVEIGLHLAFTLAEAGTPLTLGDLARLAGMSASKAHRYLVSLCRTGIVKQDEQNGPYDLGARALHLGMAALRRVDEFHFADEAITKLSDETSLTTGLSVWGDNGPTVVRRKEGADPVTVAARVGTVMSVVDTNAGRLFAAFLPAHKIMPIVEAEFTSGGLPMYMGRPLNRAQFDRLLDQIREQRLCVNRSDTVVGIDAASAPVFDSEGNIVMVISIMGIPSSIDLDPNGRPVQALKRVAAELSSRLGCRGTRVFEAGIKGSQRVPR